MEYHFYKSLWKLILKFDTSMFYFLLKVYLIINGLDYKPQLEILIIIRGINNASILLIVLLN